MFQQSSRPRGASACGLPVRVAGLLLLLLWTTAASAAEAEYYRLGVLPLQSPTKLAGMFSPLVGLMEQELDRPVQFVTAPSFSAFMDRVARREYHVIYLNPLLYTEARAAGYRAVAKVAGEPFTGILVVRGDSSIRTLDPERLPRGLRIGFPDPGAYAATVMTRQYMESLGIHVDEWFQVEYFGSQDSALLALHAGLVDIIGTWRPSFRSMPEAVRSELRIIAETPPQPQMPVAVRDDVPAADVRQLVALLTGLGGRTDGRVALERLGFLQGFDPATDSEYREVGRER